MIAMTGATGTVGRALLAELTGRGHRPRLLLRAGSAGPTAVARLGEPVPADLTRPEQLPAALAGVRRLFLLTPLHPEQDRLQLALIEAARRAGVARVVKVSAWGADPAAAAQIHRQHGRADRALAASGMAYALLRPNAFMQNARQWLGGVAREGVIPMPVGAARVSMVDARDVAAVAAALLLARAEPSGTTVDLSGPEALSYPDVAAALSFAAGRPIRHLDVAPARAAELMRASGMPDWAVQARLELYATYRAGAAAAVTTGVAEVLGRPPGTFASYVASQLADRLAAEAT
jgi:uncharacterized protein YbjT (DUF2867 family)